MTKPTAQASISTNDGMIKGNISGQAGPASAYSKGSMGVTHGNFSTSSASGYNVGGIYSSQYQSDSIGTSGLQHQQGQSGGLGKVLYGSDSSYNSAGSSGASAGGSTTYGAFGHQATFTDSVSVDKHGAHASMGVNGNNSNANCCSCCCQPTCCCPPCRTGSCLSFSGCGEALSSCGKGLAELFCCVAKTTLEVGGAILGR